MYLFQEFQVNAENPLVGLEGRLKLLQRLGKVLEKHPSFFGTDNLRPENMADYILCCKIILTTKQLKPLLY
ncbi:DUF1688 family protein [Dapis sp. BLCC M229]|uniref:DUF1688 family protein n=1 Tax=Dapis sp. BLCC M229 TaxID=3400188 RepID=UPI003CF5990B